MYSTMTSQLTFVMVRYGFIEINTYHFSKGGLNGSHWTSLEH